MVLQVESTTKMTKGADHLELHGPSGYACRVMVSSIPKLIIIVRIELHAYNIATYIILYVLLGS